MNITRSLKIASIAAIAATCGDFLLLFVGNSWQAGTRFQSSEALLAVGGLLGCVAMPCYAFGYAALARMVRPKARVTATVMLFSAIAFGIVCSVTHAVTWMTIRSSINNAATSSSLSPMESVVSQGGLLLKLWIIGTLVGLVLAISLTRSGMVRPRPIPLWLALLNPLTLVILIGVASVFSTIGRSYTLPMAPNLAHIGFFLASWRSFRSPPSAETIARAAAGN